jgi:tetratricopeptide (TPR) repeat protein
VSALLVFAIFAVYLQVRNHEFTNYDDPIYVAEMRAGLTAASLARALTTPIVSNWIPVTRVSLLAAYAAYGEAPGRHLLTGVALHAASSVLLFLVLLGMTGAWWRSAFVAAVFGLHPLHVENVAWFSDRQDLMSGFFFMLLLGAWSAYAKAPSAGRYGVALLCLTLGLLSKPMLVSAPFVLLLLDYWPLGRLTRAGASTGLDRDRVRRAVLEKVPMLALVAVISAVSLLTQSQIGALADTELFPVSVRISNALASYVAYVQAAFWPSGLAIFYPYPRDSISVLRAAACAAALLAASLLFLWNAKRPALLVGWLWFLGMLVPVIGLVQIRAEARADRYLYLPLIGLAITTAWGASEALGHSRASRAALAAVATAAVLAMAVVSWHQVGTWHDAIALDEHAVRVTTNNFRAVSDLAEVLRRKGRMPEAEARYLEALDLRPNDARMHIGLAELYFNAGRLFEAIRWYQSGLRLDPLHVRAQINLGHALRLAGRLPEARAAFARALQIDQADSLQARGMGDFLISLHLGMASVLWDLGEMDAAIPHYAEVLRLRPGHGEEHGEIGLLLARSGRAQAARPHLLRALQSGAATPEMVAEARSIGIAGP